MEDTYENLQKKYLQKRYVPVLLINASPFQCLQVNTHVPNPLKS